MKIPVVIIIYLLVTSLTSCEKEETKIGAKEIKLSSEQMQLVEGINRFGFDLIKEISDSETPGDNIFISPLSVHFALSMTWNGSAGNTREQMKETLYLPDLDANSINKSFNDLISELLSADKKVETSIANSIWYRDDFEVKQSFLDINKEGFDAQIEPLDFSDAAAKNVINEWVANRTNNRIENIIDEITPLHVMFLINAIYFNGIWSYEFDKENTHDRTFYLYDGQEKLVPTMELTEEFAYASREDYQVLEIPYGHGNFSMLVFLPDEGVSPETLIQYISVEEWNEINSLLDSPVKKSLRLPRFNYTYDLNLNNTLTRLGMVDAFNNNNADFAGIMEEQIFISEVKHKAFVDVNEEGTEAAAATSVGISFTSIPANPEFHVNRPFVFALKEKYTNSLLFIGKVMEP